jgi:hypothetical protein
LTDGDIGNLYNKKTFSNEFTGLVGYWKLDGGGGIVTVTAAPCKSSIVYWTMSGSTVNWSPAMGGFYKSIIHK